MLADEGLAEVWCESHDDLTLIWKPSGAAARVEFVQVKSNELDQLWTLPAICQRERVAKVPKTGNAANGAGTSIVEKSFANDRCSEPACFRLVTTRPVKSELEFLTLAREDERRPRARAAIQAVCEDFESRLNQPRSPRGNAIDYWLLNTVWQVLLVGGDGVPHAVALHEYAQVRDGPQEPRPASSGTHREASIGPCS